MMQRRCKTGFTFVRHVSLALGLLGLASASTALLAQNSAPSGSNRAVAVERTAILANTSLTNARVIVPDGSSLRQPVSGFEDRWFVFQAEAGKTYVIEAINVEGDLGSNAIDVLELTQADGTSAPAEAQTNCSLGLETIAPAMTSGVSSDGLRCVIRTYYPDSATTLDKRPIYVHVQNGYTPAFQIRVRESTMYGRWTTNGYDFHVEVQNTTTDPICAELVFYPGAGTPGPTGNVLFVNLNVPAKGAAKYIRPNGSTVNGDNKGVLRIHACGAPVNLVSGSVVVNTYAYNPVTNQFIPYAAPRAINNGGQNTW